MKNLRNKLPMESKNADNISSIVEINKVSNSKNSLVLRIYDLYEVSILMLE